MSIELLRWYIVDGYDILSEIRGNCLGSYDKDCFRVEIRS